MCGQLDHIHEVGAKYDHRTGVLTYMRWCVKCVWSRVVHTEEYRPAPNLDGSVSFMDDAALSSHCRKQGYREVLIMRARNAGSQAVRRAA